MAALATVGMNALGQYLSGAAADPVMRWSMVATLVFIGGATVHASLHLPRLVSDHGWRDVRTLACLALMIGGSAISLSRTHVSLSTILAANQDLVRVEASREDQRGDAIAAARARVARAAEAVAALPSLQPLEAEWRRLAQQTASARASYETEREDGGCGKLCKPLRAAYHTLSSEADAARAAYDTAADRDRQTRQDLTDAETAPG